MGRLRNFLAATVDHSSPAPRLLHLRSSKAFILTAICVAVFTDIFLYAIIVPVVPFSLITRAHVDPSSVQSWISILLAVYGAALLVGSPLAGWYADWSSSRRLPLLGGLVTLTGATLMLCLARTVALLVVGRILQGLSASIVWTVGQALLVDTVGQKEIGQTLGWVSLSMSMGMLVGPLLGGIVYEKAGYYSVFYMAFALLALDIFMRLVLIEKKLARRWAEKEVPVEPTAVSSPMNERANGATSPVPADHDAEKEAATTPDPIMEDAPAGVPRSSLPPVFLLLKSRRLLTALWGCVVQGSLMSAFDSVVPLFTSKVFHWDSVGGGLVFLAVVVPNLAAPAVGWLSDNYGARWPAVGGFIIAIPFWVLLRLVTHDSLDQKVLFVALMALIGFALTLVMPPLMAEITYAVEAKEKQNPDRFGPTGAYAQAYGLFVAAFAAGTLIGPIWSGYVNQVAGWGTMSWSLGLFSIAGAIPCLIFTGGLITRTNAKSGDERAIDSPAMPSGKTELDSEV
jgi:MFS family permease